MGPLTVWYCTPAEWIDEEPDEVLLSELEALELASFEAERAEGADEHELAG